MNNSNHKIFKKTKYSYLFSMLGFVLTLVLASGPCLASHSIACEKLLTSFWQHYCQYDPFYKKYYCYDNSYKALLALRNYLDFYDHEFEEEELNLIIIVREEAKDIFSKSLHHFTKEYIPEEHELSIDGARYGFRWHVALLFRQYVIDPDHTTQGIPIPLKHYLHSIIDLNGVNHDPNLLQIGIVTLENYGCNASTGMENDLFDLFFSPLTAHSPVQWHQMEGLLSLKDSSKKDLTRK